MSLNSPVKTSYGVKPIYYYNAINDKRFNPENALGSFPSYLKSILISSSLDIAFILAVIIFFFWFTFSTLTIQPMVNSIKPIILIKSTLFNDVSYLEETKTYMPSGINWINFSMGIALSILVILFKFYALFIYHNAIHDRTHREMIYYSDYQKKLEQVKVKKSSNVLLYSLQILSILLLIAILLCLALVVPSYTVNDFSNTSSHIEKVLVNVPSLVLSIILIIVEVGFFYVLVINKHLNAIVFAIVRTYDRVIKETYIDYDEKTNN